MGTATRKKGAASGKGSPLFGAAVVKAVLRKRTGEAGATSTLYESILRDLGITDTQVEEYLAAHEDEVEEAIRSHGRRGS